MGWLDQRYRCQRPTLVPQLGKAIQWYLMINRATDLGQLAPVIAPHIETLSALTAIEVDEEDYAPNHGPQKPTETPEMARLASVPLGPSFNTSSSAMCTATAWRVELINSP